VDREPDPTLVGFDRSGPAVTVSNDGGDGSVQVFVRFRHDDALVNVIHRRVSVAAGTRTSVSLEYGSFPGVTCSGPDDVALYGGLLSGRPMVRFESAPMVECHENREFVPVRFHNDGGLGRVEYTVTVEGADGTASTGGPWEIPVEPRAPGADSWGFIHHGSEIVDVSFDPVSPSTSS
jgi:hypothetical protein